ncbi:DUF551 domain-containing protein [Pandoraea sputorum]|uniref:DUF551 domain-containing protein n=1 Tax=Pandoraea sputorum TaxID=93222 RepID=A0A5E5BK74_9BURK|nr:DUF551 domain-containing protein [Pandoraea sputorum]VVE85748.1 hypothetical protein PSP31121_05401 [Pandoraea sputorum]
MTSKGWISVADRLPELSPSVARVTALVIVNDAALLADGEPGFVDIATYWRDKSVWTITCRSIDRTVSDRPVRVTHWMLLPDPPTLD